MAAWDPETEFAALSDDFLAEPDVDPGTGFGGSPGLRVDGRIFAMLVRGRLVVKLPARRCRTLCEAGQAEPLAVGKRVMNEWIEVTAEDRQTWRDLAAEAYAFVGRRPSPAA
jgi:TfoX/Sxy family transcriptional regulator of competence genes